MTLCPCGSDQDLDNCCGPIIAGAPSPTAEALMRARYTAFAQKNLDFLEQTHAPEIRDDFNRAEAERVAEESKWYGLDVRRTVESEDGTTQVEFVARFRRDGQDLIHHEFANFRQEDGRWLYVSGELNPKSPPRQVVKIGRNDPCTCGSGKKYKKCCGA